MIVRGDARGLPFADASVQCCVTSPPYWGLRSYAGLPDSIWDGDDNCAHAWGDERACAIRAAADRAGGAGAVTVYYGDNDAFCCAWLRELIAAGELADGDVCCGDIAALEPGRFDGVRQAHFFAGIGGWPLALRLAGWPEQWPVWTGSCPCQPFSAAGKRAGVWDKRDLWPAFRTLIAECRPPVIFGEQVASADGRWWLARVRTELEGLGYAVGAADLCAAVIGAPHIRQRLFWVADLHEHRAQRAGRAQFEPVSDSQTGGVAESAGARWSTAGSGPEIDSGRESESGCPSGGMGDADGARVEGQRGDGDRGDQSGRLAENPAGYVESAGYWASRLIHCRDGKSRRIPLEPALFPLADAGQSGVGGRVGILRGAGNAIVPALAAEFVRAYLEARLTGVRA